ncbi:MAG: (d)CMP kinase [Lachnospiraceae bacterium]|nr:(d)CMP kinase [Lachnospiraceae bacterium]
MGINVAIDGPAGAGKSTIAKRVAGELGFVYVDTGAMYRTVALYMVRKGYGEEDREKIERDVSEADVTIQYLDGVQKIFLNGENADGEIRKEEIGRMASICSAFPAVREHLLSLQRKLAASGNVVMDGRDIGTVILPNAEVKVFLTADPGVRARRRYDELIGKGQKADLEEIEREVRARDERDMNRETAPLKQADDAVLIDSSDMTIDEVAEEIVKLVRPHMG